MFDDANDSSEYEPDEPDPEAEYAPDVPAVSIPDTSDVDVPPAVTRTFWRVVIIVDIGVLAVSLGLMAVYFWGTWLLGGSAVAIGIVALAHGFLIYRRHQRQNR